MSENKSVAEREAERTVQTSEQFFRELVQSATNCQMYVARLQSIITYTEMVEDYHFNRQTVLALALGEPLPAKTSEEVISSGEESTSN